MSAFSTEKAIPLVFRPSSLASQAHLTSHEERHAIFHKGTSLTLENVDASGTKVSPARYLTRAQHVNIQYTVLR